MKVEAGGRSIEVGNPGKVLFPESGITKADLVEYYRRIAEVMVPYVRSRPVTMHRFPDGVGAPGFYQQDAPGHFPEWIRTVTVSTEEGDATRVVCEDAATLVYLAEQACITPHVWLSTVEHLDRPDRLVFDLDPPEGSGPAPVRSAAEATGALLDDLGLRAGVMTTGSSGFHVVVPLDGVLGFDEVRDFASRCARVLAARHPETLTVEHRIDRRAGRVFLDYLRNAYAQTTVAPYAVRGLSGAPVAAPIDWSELGTTEPQSYTVANIFRRLGQKQDPWSAEGIPGQALDDARPGLARLEE